VTPDGYAAEQLAEIGVAIASDDQQRREASGARN
jgi:hypothetical protein